LDDPNWLGLASLVVGVGGLLVAVVGFLLNALAIRREQADRKEAVDAQWAQMWTRASGTGSGRSA
jgi:hypothetical protein